MNVLVKNQIFVMPRYCNIVQPTSKLIVFYMFHLHWMYIYTYIYFYITVYLAACIVCISASDNKALFHRNSARDVITKKVFTEYIVLQITVSLCTVITYYVYRLKNQKSISRNVIETTVSTSSFRYFNQAADFYFWYSGWSFFDMETHSKAFAEFTTAILYSLYRCFALEQRV